MKQPRLGLSLGRLTSKRFGYSQNAQLLASVKDSPGFAEKNVEYCIY